MKPQILSVVAVIAWEAIKDGVKLTYTQLKKKFQERKLSQICDQDCEQIVDIINNIPDAYKLNELLVEGYLQSNLQLMDIISKCAKDATTTVAQTHYGIGDNIGHDKVVRG